MASLERRHYRIDQVILDNQFDFPLFNLLNHPSLPEKRLAAVQRAELALAKGLPRTAVIIADSPPSGGEYGTFDSLDMAWWHEEAELVHL
ncbi:hypothetical protein D9M71_166700 [compost metagenome]